VAIVHFKVTLVICLDELSKTSKKPEGSRFPGWYSILGPAKHVGMLTIMLHLMYLYFYMISIVGKSDVAFQLHILAYLPYFLVVR
jgi:hypothetical protein